MVYLQVVAFLFAMEGWRAQLEWDIAAGLEHLDDKCEDMTFQEILFGFDNEG